MFLVAFWFQSNRLCKRRTSVKHCTAFLAHMIRSISRYRKKTTKCLLSVHLLGYRCYIMILSSAISKISTLPQCEHAMRFNDNCGTEEVLGQENIIWTMIFHSTLPWSFLFWNAISYIIDKTRKGFENRPLPKSILFWFRVRIRLTTAKVQEVEVKTRHVRGEFDFSWF